MSDTSGTGKNIPYTKPTTYNTPQSPLTVREMNLQSAAIAAFARQLTEGEAGIGYGDICDYTGCKGYRDNFCSDCPIRKLTNLPEVAK